MIDVRGAVASDTSLSTVTMRVPQYNWDISSVDGLNLVPAQRLRTSSAESFEVSAETLDSIRVGGRACAMKIDAEGYEPAVVRGAESLLHDQPPHAILLEYSPGSVERSAQGGLVDALERPPVRYADFPAMLSTLRGTGYRIWQLNNAAKYKPFAGGMLAREKEVLSTSIEAETLNADNVRRRYVAEGFAFPWDVHPLSLRASFEYNTGARPTTAAPSLICLS